MKIIQIGEINSSFKILLAHVWADASQNVLNDELTFMIFGDEENVSKLEINYEIFNRISFQILLAHVWADVSPKMY